MGKRWKLEERVRGKGSNCLDPDSMKAGTSGDHVTLVLPPADEKMASERLDAR